MSLMLQNRTEQTTNTTGTADFQLIAPGADRLPFDGVGSGEEVPYFAENATGTEWEYGRGTITSGTPDLLARTTVLKSSSSNNKVNFSAGLKTVYLTLSADIGAVNTIGVNITGSTTITGLGSHRNTRRTLKFAASLVLTHRAPISRPLPATSLR